MEITQQTAVLQNVVEAQIPANAPKQATPKELNEATQQFEAILLRQFIGEALKPLLHDTLGSQVAGAGVYQQMVSEVIADNLAQSGDFGFSSMLQIQLAGAAQEAPADDELK